MSKDETNINKNDGEGIVDIDLNTSSSTDISTNILSVVNSVNKISEIIVKSPIFIASITEVITAFQENIAKIFSSSIDFSGLLIDFSKKIAEYVANIHIPDISEEEKKKLVESYETWGKYGWTINPCASIDSWYDVIPSTKKEADKRAIEECKNMDKLFNAIRENKRLKKDDFEEAIEDFNAHKYKSCALLLMTSIEAKLIRLQGRQNRKVGEKAVEKAKKKADWNKEKEVLFLNLFYINYFSCLEVMFKKADDFRKQPEVINRNYLCHGMLTRRVYKRDCIQLFLLYYNTLEFLDMVYS